MNTKYIIGPYGPIVFDECYTHADIARGLTVTSAGFVFFGNDGKFHCHGKSTSLGINSKPEEDSREINKLFEIDE
jgi:hypothetical protein